MSQKSVQLLPSCYVRRNRHDVFSRRIFAAFSSNALKSLRESLKLKDVVIATCGQWQGAGCHNAQHRSQQGELQLLTHRTT